jgi:hypothetical protein
LNKVKTISQVAKILGNLEKLILSLIQKYGPLDTDQIRQLVDCYNQTGQYASNLTITSSINEALTKMHYDFHLVTFSPVSKLWYEINDQNIHKIPEKKFISVGSRLGNPIVLNPKEIFLNRFGIGNEYVYVIYSSDARIESILNNFIAYPVKVGKTNCIQRRIDQLSESGPNTLTVGAVFCTNNSTELERYIHTKLIDAGRHLVIPGRREWFRSDIETIIKIYREFLLDRSAHA